VKDVEAELGEVKWWICWGKNREIDEEIDLGRGARESPESKTAVATFVLARVLVFHCLFLSAVSDRLLSFLR
jgi:hypothetical protein